MAFPTRAELEEQIKGYKATGIFATNRENLAEHLEDRINRPDPLYLRRTDTLAQHEADRSQTSRFLEELGVGLGALGQGVMRGTTATFAQLPALGISPLREKLQGRDMKFVQPVFDPTQARMPRLATSLYGEEPLSISSEGQDLMSLFGAEEGTKERYGFLTGLGMSAIDLFPGGRGAKSAFIKNAAKSTAKLTETQEIMKVLKSGLKGSDEDLQTLANALRGISDPKETEALIRKAVFSVKTVNNIARLADEVRATGVDRQQFLHDIQKGLDGTGNAKLRAQQFVERLRTSGLTPEAFYDGLVSSKPLTNKPRLDTVGRRVFDRTRAGDAEYRALKERISELNTVIKQAVTPYRRELKNARGIARSEIAKAADQATKRTKAEINALQSQLEAYVETNLPVALRGKHLRDLRKATTPGRLNKALDRAHEKVTDYNLMRQTAKEVSKRKSKLALIRKLSELNSAAMRDVLKTVGIKKGVTDRMRKNAEKTGKPPIDRLKRISEMTSKELDRVIEEASKRFEFKREHGLVTPKEKVDGVWQDKKPDKPKRVTREDAIAYGEAVEAQKGWWNKMKRKLFSAKEEVGKGDIIGILSEELRAIGAEDVLVGLRKMGHRARVNEKRLVDTLDTIIEKLGLDKSKRVIDDVDYHQLTLAMNNGDITTVNAIAKKYGVTKEFKRLRAVLDGVHKRATEVGIDTAYRKGFFPRLFKQDAATKKEALEYFKTKHGNIIDEAYQEFARNMGRMPTEEERWKILNNLIRGYNQQGISLSTVGAFKRRIVEEITPKTAHFYEDPFVALTRYADQTNSLVEARRFFGKHLGADIKDLPPEAALDDVAGAAIDNMIATGKMAPENAERLRELLTARFRGGQMGSGYMFFKNMGYLTLMADPISATTQIGDVEKVLYRAGLRKAVPAIWRAVFNPTKQEIRLGDFGLDRTISAEMATAEGTAKMVNTGFKRTGLTWVDRLGKESFLNGVLEKYRKGVTSGKDEIIENIYRVMGDEAEDTIRALEKGVNTENVRFLMLNELADYFPVTLEEVPVSYLKHPNGRVFYAMKTFTTKQLNNYRREIFREWKNGNKAQAAKNATRLIGLFVMMNATADEIKEWMTGRDSTISDKVTDNLLKTFGFNKYSLDRSQQYGLGRTLLEQILPPSTWIDDVSRDFVDVFEGDFNLNDARFIRDIPAGGELYYWWFGGGQERAEKERAAVEGSSGGGGSSRPRINSSTSRNTGTRTTGTRTNYR